MAKDASTILSEAERTTTIGVVGVTKPILKFSVSAILGDRKECVKVRNGTWLMCFYQILKYTVISKMIKGLFSLFSLISRPHIFKPSKHTQGDQCKQLT